jgi:hypothetical protein
MTDKVYAAHNTKQYVTVKVEQSNLALIFEAALLQGPWLMAEMVMVLVLWWLLGLDPIVNLNLNFLMTICASWLRCYPLLHLHHR